MENEVELCVEVGSNIGDTWVENADINQLCRSCANTHDNMIPIFEGDGLEHDLQNKIDKHFPVNISRDDGLPHQMCYQCASTLVAWHDMYMGCIDAENKLKNLLKKSTAKGQVEKTVAGSSIASAVSASVEPDSQQKMASEMEVDNDDNDDDDDDDDVPEHGGDDNDDEEDDDDDNDDEDEEVEEIVLHKLEAKAKEKNVEVNEKGTTIRDQFMVMNNDTGQMQMISMYLHRNDCQNTLKLSSNLFTNSVFKENGQIIENLVKYVRENHGLNDETFEIELESLEDNETGDGLMTDSISKVDNVLLPSDINTTENNKQNSALELAVDVSFYCRKCTLIFERAEEFETHMNTHKSSKKTSEFGNEENVCSGSSHLFFRNRSISKHKNENPAARPRNRKLKSDPVSREPNKIVTKTDFYCNLCDKYYKSRNLLASHTKIHSEKKFVCETCGKKFSMRSDFRRHKLTHSLVKPFKCHICPDAFNQKRYLKTHFQAKHDMDSEEIAEKLKVFEVIQKAMRAVDPDRVREIERGPRICKVCNAQFKYAFEFRRHFQVRHSDARPYQCQVCNATFKLADNLQKHSFYHAEKKLVCETCGKKFSAPNDFKRHLIIHNGLKPFKCQLCSRNFNQKRSLTAHIRRKHHINLTKAGETVENHPLSTHHLPSSTASEMLENSNVDVTVSNIDEAVSEID